MNCKTKSYLKAYLFALSILGKNFTAGNIPVFKGLNIMQMGLDESNTQ